MKVINKNDKTEMDDTKLNGLVTIQIEKGVIVDITIDKELSPLFSTPRKAMTAFEFVKNAVMDMEIKNAI